nr:hypothetical protein Iba_chr08dCG13390 [Ipomoea batatas]
MYSSASIFSIDLCCPNSFAFFCKDTVIAATSFLSSPAPPAFCLAGSYSGTKAASRFLLFSEVFSACFSCFSCHFLANFLLSLRKYSPLSSCKSTLLGGCGGGNGV